jgi:hypoxanthine-DNA glycosylase
MHTFKLQGLPPILSRQTRLLVLGSFPGVASLEAQQYYAHPQNAFWRIWQSIWHDSLRGKPLRERTYAQRIQAARAHGLGLWDVYAACTREGSLDSAIRNAQLNDFASLAKRCPALRVVAHNGGHSARHAPLIRSLLGDSVHVVTLPSTSPANAGWSFARKLDAWQSAWALAA